MLTDNWEAVNGSFEIYVSQTTHRTNVVIRVLTMVSTVLFTSSVLISLFGLTVQVSWLGSSETVLCLGRAK